MTSERRNRNLTRDGILKMLSTEEAASVTSAETAAPLMDGEVYVDLMRLDQGVRRARGETTPMRPVLPKKAVHEKTWASIVQRIAALQDAARGSKS
jgi:hypothetical protein